jgi:p21-activated kinase 1
MILSSREETYDSYTPSSRTSTDRVLHRRSTKESIQSHDQGSISNSSVHTNASKATIHKDLSGHSGQLGQSPFLSSHSTLRTHSSIVLDTSISDHKSLHNPAKQSFGFRNQSLSTVCTTPEPDSGSIFTASSTPRQKFRSLNLSALEDEDESSLPSTPCSSHTSSLLVSPRPNLHPNPPPPSTAYAVRPSLPPDDGDSPFSPTSSDSVFLPRFESLFPPPTNRTSTVSTVSRSRSRIVTTKGKKGMLSFMTDFLNSDKRPDISTPYDPLHLTHISFNSSTGRFTGVPKQFTQEDVNIVDEIDEAEKVKRLQQICMAVDPTRLYHCLVKIGQG